MLATRTLEFDRIVDAVAALALTPLGTDALAGLEPATRVTIRFTTSAEPLRR